MNAPAPQRDFIGWICLVLVLVPPLWPAAPAVLVLSSIRLGLKVRADEELPSPTVVALAFSFGVTCFLGWYLWKVASGAQP